MSLLPECPCCFGLMTGNSNSTLSSACRCGYPEKVTWEQFPKAEDALAGAREQRRAAA